MAEWSAVIPAYNAAETLRASVESAFASGAAEVIVVDDGSADDTAALAGSLGAKVVSQSNAGAAVARMTGLREVETPLVIFLDSDDALIPAGISRSLDALSDNPDAAAALGCFRMIAGGKVGSLSRTWPEGVNTESLLSRGHSPGPPAVVLWRVALLHAALANPPAQLAPRYAEDYELVLRGSRTGAILQHPWHVCDYQASAGKSASQPMASQLDAERLRNYYGQAWGFEVQARSRCSLVSATLRRRALTLQVVRGRHAYWAMMATAAIADPLWAYRGLRRKFTPSGSRTSLPGESGPAA